jgi:phosphoribosylformimino-5-aminoimidazole carboxamide ribotide isomerase
MIVIPAVDLRDGACVQLVGGEYAEEKVRLDDPLAVAREWARLGFRRLHVVDLDAATGRGSNAATVAELVRHGGFDVVQVGGGVRDEAAIERLLDAGASAVVVGTRALEDEDWLREMAERFPGELVLAADVRERRIVTRGWTQTLPRIVTDLVEELHDVPLAAVMVTAVHKEGQMQGTDLPLMEDVVEAAHVPVFASGGVSSAADLRALEDRGVAGAIVGMALYTGALDAHAVIEEFHED